MKKLSLAILFVSASLLSFAADLNTYLSASNTDQKSITVNFAFFEPIKTTLKITSERGNVLYKEVSDSPEAMKSYFLVDKLSDGNFFVTIENAIQTVETKFLIKDGVVVTGDSKKYFKPTFVQKGSSIVVNLLNPEQESVTIRVLNKEGQELITFDDSQTFVGRTLNCAALVGQDITIQTVQGTFTNSKDFSLYEN